FFLMIPPPPRPTLFPYTTLFRSHPRRLEDRVREHPEQTPKRGGEPLPLLDLSERRPLPDLPRMIHEHRVPARPEDAIRLAEERVRRRMHVEGVDVHDLVEGALPEGIAPGEIGVAEGDVRQMLRAPLLLGYLDQG